jgi:hypothetical protein
VSDPQAARYLAGSLATAKSTLHLGERALTAHATDLAAHMGQHRDDIAEVHVAELARLANERRAAARVELEQHRSFIAGSILRQLSPLVSLSVDAAERVDRLQQLLDNAEASIERLSNGPVDSWERSWTTSSSI